MITECVSMKKKWAFVYERLKTASLIFAVFLFFLTLLSEYMNIEVPYIATFNYIVLFLFALAVSFINLVFRIKKVGFQVRLLLHAVLMIVNICVLFYFNGMTVGGAHMTPKTLIAVITAVAVVYALIDAGVLVFNLFTKSKGEDDYSPMFKNK